MNSELEILKRIFDICEKTGITINHYFVKPGERIELHSWNSIALITELRYLGFIPNFKNNSHTITIFADGRKNAK